MQLPGLHSRPIDSESLGTFLKIGDGFEELSCLGTSSLPTRILILLLVGKHLPPYSSVDLRLSYKLDLCFILV